MSPSKNGGQPRTTQFQPGHPGGPGRRDGSRNRATLILDALADGEAEAMLRRVVEAAKAGDLKAAEIVLSRVWPAKKGRPVRIDLPAIKTAPDVLAGLAAVLEATSRGDLTPDEAASVANLLEIKRRAIEIVDIESRLTRLEAAREGKQ